MKSKRERRRESVEAAAARADALLAAHAALVFARFAPRHNAHRVDPALARLSPEDARWIRDLEARRLREFGCLAEIVERRTGAKLTAAPPPPPEANDTVAYLQDRRRRRPGPLI